MWPPPAVVAPAPSATWPPSWYPDPWEPGTVRWWDGRAWTGHTARPAVAPPEPFRALPVVAAWLGLVVTAGALVGARLGLEVLGRFDWPIVVYALLATLLGYGPMVAYCWWASRRWGTGSLADDVGARVRWIDLGWGPVVWIAAWVGGIAAAIIVYALHLPIKSNTDGIDRYSGDRGVLIAFLIVAVVVAPLARLEYAEICDPVTLERVDVITEPAVLAVAIWVGPVRLIDNVTLVPGDAPCAGVRGGP